MIEQVAFSAREDKKVDKRSGVSQRLPIATLELAVSNAERRALMHGETRVVPRVGDLYTALPGITGKLELEYEGEMKGADTVVRDIVRAAIGKVFDRYFGDDEHAADRAVVQPGRNGEDQRRACGEGDAGGAEQIQGLMEKLAPLGVKARRWRRSGDGGGGVSAGRDVRASAASAATRSASFSAQQQAQEGRMDADKAEPMESGLEYVQRGNAAENAEPVAVAKPGELRGLAEAVNQEATGMERS